MNYLYLGFISLCTFSSWNLSAQPDHRFPVEFFGEQIYIPVCIGNSSDTLNFIWDTGMNNTYIDSAAASRLGLRATGTTQSAGVVGSSNFGVVENQVLRVHTATLPPHRLSISNFSSLSAGSGKRIDGIIGNQFNHQFIVWLDVDN